MKKLTGLIIGLIMVISSYGQTDTTSFPLGMGPLSSISATDYYLTDDGDSAQTVTMQDIMDYLEGNMALETLLTKTIGGDVTITGTNTENIVFRASQSGTNSASIKFYSDGVLDLGTYANDNYTGDQAYIQFNEQYLLLSVVYADDEQSILMSSSGMIITDTEDLVGLQYAADYSTNGLSNSRWIPDISAVRSEISDSVTAAGGGTMVYPGAGIPLSTGSAWGTSITNNSANWNTAYGWGDHASAGYLLASDSVSLIAGANITLTESVTGDSLTIASTATGDVSLSDSTVVFATPTQLSDSLTANGIAATAPVELNTLAHMIDDIDLLFTYGYGVGMLSDTIGCADSLNAFGYFERAEDSTLVQELKVDVSTGDTLNAYLVTGTTLWTPVDTLCTINAGAGRTTITSFTNATFPEDTPCWIEMGTAIDTRKPIKWRASMYGTKVRD